MNPNSIANSGSVNAPGQCVEVGLPSPDQKDLATECLAVGVQAQDVGCLGRPGQQIDHVVGVADRIVIYRGGLLHCSMIPTDMPLSDDPRLGRLTANLFIRIG